MAVQDKKDVGKDEMKVTFNKGSSVAVTNNSKPGFVVLAIEDGVESTTEGAENAGLVPDANGNFVKQVSSSGSHHNYQWMHNNDKHWQLCSDCGSVINEGTHNFQWKQDENGVGYQQCADCGYRKSATQTAAAATNNATASASASASTTTNATATAAIPQTSDASNPLLWVVLLVISGSAFGGLMVYKKKKENC